MLLVHLKDDPLFRITIPSKTQFYLATGKPILMGIRGDAAELLVKTKAGLVVAPQDAAALAGAVTHLARLSKQELAEIGARGRMFYEFELSTAIGVSRTLAIFDCAIAARNRSSMVKRIFDVVVAGAALVILSPYDADYRIRTVVRSRLFNPLSPTTRRNSMATRFAFISFEQ